MHVLIKDVWKLKKAIVISAVIIVSIIAIAVGLSRTQQPTQPQPTLKRVNLTNSYEIVNNTYIILNNGNVTYYNITVIIQVYKLHEASFTIQAFQFEQTITLNESGYTYGIVLPNIPYTHTYITSITADTFI